MPAGIDLRPHDPAGLHRQRHEPAVARRLAGVRVGREQRDVHQALRDPERRRGRGERPDLGLPQLLAGQLVERLGRAVVVDHVQRVLVDDRRELEQRVVLEAPADVQRRLRDVAPGKKCVRSASYPYRGQRKLLTTAFLAWASVVVGARELRRRDWRRCAASAGGRTPPRLPPRSARPLRQRVPTAATVANRDSAWRAMLATAHPGTACTTVHDDPRGRLGRNYDYVRVSSRAARSRSGAPGRAAADLAPAGRAGGVPGRRGGSGSAARR